MPEKRDRAIQTKVAERIRDRVAVIAPLVAERQRPVLGNVPVSKVERRRRWWQQADDWPTDPQEGQARELALLGYNPDWTPKLDANDKPVKGLTRQDVGLIRFPNREIDMRAAGDGDDDTRMAAYAREMTSLGPPPPEPLEAAALSVQAPESTTLATPAPEMPDAPVVPEPGGY